MQKCVLGKAEKSNTVHAKSCKKMPFAYKKHPLKPSLKGCLIIFKNFCVLRPSRSAQLCQLIAAAGNKVLRFAGNYQRNPTQLHRRLRT